MSSIVRVLKRNPKRARELARENLVLTKRNMTLTGRVGWFDVAVLLVVAFCAGIMVGRLFPAYTFVQHAQAQEATK